MHIPCADAEPSVVPSNRVSAHLHKSYFGYTSFLCVFLQVLLENDLKQFISQFYSIIVVADYRKSNGYDSVQRAREMPRQKCFGHPRQIISNIEGNLYKSGL